ncbi:MAG TPA: transporter [Deltaproteobacteria bacterium]|nr:transporter [Deltaproteobacteria bacterium]
MKRILEPVWGALGLLFLLTGPACAGMTCAYTNGVEGIKAASLPPAGTYYLMYNVFYEADKLMDDRGDELKPVDMELSVYAIVHRLLVMTDKKVLGGDYGFDIVLPTVNTDVSNVMGSDNYFGLGDITVEPFIVSWHKPRYDAVIGAAVTLPTGQSDEGRMAQPGKDYWTGMLTAGGTVFFDTDKTWSASLLARYEMHGEKRSGDLKAGDDFHFEWGVGKSVTKTVDVGVAGYCQWQVTNDRGDDVTWEKNDRDRVFAIGPEADIFLPGVTLFVNWRTLAEFDAVDRTEGVIMAIKLVKPL